MERLLDTALAKPRTKPPVSQPTPAQKQARRGRPPALSEAELRQRRDQLEGIFAAHWPIIGWNLQRARKPTHITDALRPLASLNHPTTGLFLVDSFSKLLPDASPQYKQECKRLDSQLVATQDRLSEANAKVLEASSAFERAHNFFATARDGYSHARKEKKPTASFLKEREKWLRRRDFLQTELDRRMKTQIQYADEIRGTEKEIKEIEAHFAQTELLRFVLSERYVFNPLNFANAAAGLPHMGWRRSFFLCSRMECSGETSINFLIFDAVKTILEGASPTGATEAASEIRRQISKQRQFQKIRAHLGEHWPALENAVLTVWNSSVHVDARPYEIASRYPAALKASRRVVNPLLDALERDLPPT